jgi:phospholipid/cholesterol/gamma-HCH transport system substrate-binding protein
MSRRAIVRTTPLMRKALVSVVVIGLALMAVKVVVASGTKHGVAYFTSVTSVYPGDKIRILGITVGKIDKIEASDDRVRVEFSYDSKHKLPSDVKAAIVAPTLVATRFIQLSPAYTSGPVFPDGGEIPVGRTASPLEFDDLKTELSRLSTALGPSADGSDGSLARFLDTAAEAGAGQGAKFNTMIRNLSEGLRTLSEGRGDIFATVENLHVFVGAIAAMDDEIVGFNRRLANVSDLLSDNSDELTTAITSVTRAAAKVDRFLKENRPELKRSLVQLSDVTGNLADSRDNLATLLHTGPNTLTNFVNMFDWRVRQYTGALIVDNAYAPGELACALVSTQLADQEENETGCLTLFGPLLNALSILPPVGVNGPLKGGGTYEGPQLPPDPVTKDFGLRFGPNGPISDLPSVQEGNER